MNTAWWLPPGRTRTVTGSTDNPRMIRCRAHPESPVRRQEKRQNYSNTGFKAYSGDEAGGRGCPYLSRNAAPEPWASRCREEARWSS